MVTSIKTVADLRKALSAYDENLPVKFIADGRAVRLGTDLSIFSVLDARTPQPTCVVLDLHSDLDQPRP